jgi:hypothetical protein
LVGENKMTDIVERLRMQGKDFTNADRPYPEFISPNDAADEIERLREALEIISKPTYGTELFDTAGQRAEIYWQHLKRFQIIAKKALEK